MCMEKLLRPGATTGHTHNTDSLKHGEWIVTQCCSSHLDLLFAGLIVISCHSYLFFLHISIHAESFRSNSGGISNADDTLGSTSFDVLQERSYSISPISM